jgi:hypothetical protein
MNNIDIRSRKKGALDAIRSRHVMIEDTPNANVMQPNPTYASAAIYKHHTFSCRRSIPATRTRSVEAQRYGVCLARSFAESPSSFPFRLPIHSTHSNTINSAIDLIRFLVASLSAGANVSPASTAATKPCLYEPREDGKRTCHPHEGKHCFTNARANVDFPDTANDIAKDDEHGGCYNGGGGYEERVKEGENGDEERPPAREDTDRHEEHEDKGEAGGCEEESKHDLRRDLDKIKYVIDIGWEVDWSRLSQQLGSYIQGQNEYALEAPASSSFLKISTGLNQYRVCGREQKVTPSFRYPSQNPHSPTW